MKNPYERQEDEAAHILTDLAEGSAAGPALNAVMRLEMRRRSGHDARAEAAYESLKEEIVGLEAAIGSLLGRPDASAGR